MSAVDINTSLQSNSIEVQCADAFMNNCVPIAPVIKNLNSAVPEMTQVAGERSRRVTNLPRKLINMYCGVGNIYGL